MLTYCPKSLSSQVYIKIWLPSPGPVLPGFFDELKVWFAIKGQVTKFRDIGLSRLDGEGFLDHGRVDEVGHGGVETYPLGVTKVIGMVHHHDSAFLALNGTIHRHPSRARVVPVLAGLAIGGDHFALGLALAVLLHPFGVSPDGHSSVMVLLDEQGILGGAGLGGNQIELVVGHFLTRNVDPPSLFEKRFVGVLARGEDLLEEKGTGFFLSFFPQVTGKADVTQLLGLIPKLSGFSPKGGFGPSKEETVLMGVIRGIISRYDLARRRINRMDISASGVMRIMFFGLGRGFRQVAQEGFPTFTYQEPVLSGIELDGIRRVVRPRISEGRIQGKAPNGKNR
jgi:hypothetical protein